LEKRIEDLFNALQERLNFFSQIGAEFMFSPLSSKISVYHSLRERVIHCQKCPLSQGRTNAVPGEGSLEAELMFVGEAPGRDEDLQGQPFVGRAGQLLTKIINAMEFKREDVYITNVIKCRPPENRTPYKEEIEKCQDYLLEQLELVKPKVVVALGKVATDFFVPSSKGMTALRGNFYPYGPLQVMPTFHPSYIVRNEGNRIIKKMVWEDMKKVMAFLGKR
jgi:uracil-DNA glycosylase family 4